MAEFEISIDKDAINAAVTQAVVDSVIGEQMKTAITEALKPTSYGRTSAIETVVASEVQRLVREVMAAEYADPIKTAIRERLTNEALDALAGASVDWLVSTMKNRR